MSGKEILVDTNIILYLLKGNDTIEKFLQNKKVYISFITELELIGFKDIADNDKQRISQLLDECIIVSLTKEIKEIYVKIKAKYRLKLADAIIVSTAITLGLPLISADKQLIQINELDLITYQYEAKLADDKSDI